MKALTLHQPWATLIALNVKTIETRSWRASVSLIGQRIAIHAGSHRPLLADVGDWSTFYSPDRECFIMREYPDGRCADLPFGAIVATATLTDCLPMATHYDTFDPECLVIHDDSIDHVLPPDEDQSASRGSALPDPGAALIVDISDQLPYGWFAPGRWAWMLDDITPCDPVPAKGKQGVWEWLP